MSSVRILLSATAMELSFGCAALAALGLAGARDGWLDVINNFAPFGLVLGLVALGLAAAAAPRGAVRGACLALAGASVIVGAALVGPEIARWRPASPATGPAFQLLSANVWADNPEPDAAVAAIARLAPDVVLLQESDGNLATPLAGLRQLYPYGTDCPKSGVRILVKTPVGASGCDLGAGDIDDRDVAWLSTTTATGAPVTLVTVHFTWPFPPEPQARQRQALAAWVKARPPQDVILAGDFNTTPWSFAMRWQDAALAPLQRRTIAWFTWPARLDLFRTPWSAPVLPIDHLYTGPDWRVVSLQRERIPGSDHFATLATISGSR
ncbi:MAG TPA: endonuclease/exonuclease/phosphatase family protein [Caulobacteraceae bacterium]